MAGICGLHVAAWHFYEPDPGPDDYLRRLIESCHRRGILVYAWLELPHVSEKFWLDHPAWREKTALLQDAHLDWRKLMNLASRECFAEVSAGVLRLVERFDWDGVNLAEMYFESLQGHENPSRFTPMNDDVRRQFRERGGFDPLELFDKSSPRHLSKNESGLRLFLDFRAELARGIQEEWLGEMETARRSKPDLDIVLTHVDDRFDPRMRDALGADTAAVLPLVDRHGFTFLVEDPATVWHLGPERYGQIASKYRTITPHGDRLAIDINIAERYQDVYPTKQQTGTELFQLVSQAAHAFPRVALYFENSILATDVPWLASAAAAVKLYERREPQVVVDSLHGFGIRWQGAALLDGRLWPVGDGETLWIPAGRHTLEPASGEPPARLLDFTGELTGAASRPGGLEFAYNSLTRAFALLSRRPQRVEIDGVPAQPHVLDSSSHSTLVASAWPARGDGGRQSERILRPKRIQGSYCLAGCGAVRATSSPAARPDTIATSVAPSRPSLDLPLLEPRRRLQEHEILTALGVHRRQGDDQRVLPASDDDFRRSRKVRDQARVLALDLNRERNRPDVVTLTLALHGHRSDTVNLALECKLRESIQRDGCRLPHTNLAGFGLVRPSLQLHSRSVHDLQERAAGSNRVAYLVLSHVGAALEALHHRQAVH